MKDKEIVKIIIAIVILTLVIGFVPIINGNFEKIGIAILSAFVIILANVLGKNIAAANLDASVEHEIWMWERYGFHPIDHLEKPIPLGIIAPLVGTAITLGALKLMSILTFETSALKRRAAKRHGRTSFTEMTDWHIALIGASGIIFVLIASFIAYWIPGLETLSKFAAYYAFWNLIPFSKLDGSQIFFGSRILWTTLAVITLIFVAYAILLI